MCSKYTPGWASPSPLTILNSCRLNSNRICAAVLLQLHVHKIRTFDHPSQSYTQYMWSRRNAHPLNLATALVRLFWKHSLIQIIRLRIAEHWVLLNPLLPDGNYKTHRAVEHPSTYLQNQGIPNVMFSNASTTGPAKRLELNIKPSFAAH